MSTSRFCHIYGLAIIFGFSVYSGSRAHGAIPHPTPPGARTQAHGAWTAAVQTRALTFEIYQDKTNQHRWRLKATNGQVIATSGERARKR